LDALFQITQGQHHVFIVDDNFIGNKAAAKTLLRQMIVWSKAHGEPFGFNAQASIDLGQDLEMIDLLTEANFNEVCIGIESPDEEALKSAGKYQNLKHSLFESLTTINKNGLSTMASFIIGFDGEKKGVGERICTFVEKANIPQAVIHTLQAPPNTKLWKRLKKEGRLLEDEFDPEGFELRLNYIPTRPESEIIDEYVRTWEYLYEPSRYLARVYRSILDMRPTRRAMALEKGESLPEPVAPHANVKASQKRKDLMALLKIFWRQGIRAGYRMQFWKQLYSVHRKNPSRFKKYIVACALLEDFYKYRNAIREWQKLNAYELEGRDTGRPDEMGASF
jgi:radical SAM superfamily enzyme YgiQ (UPF0313 family)